MGQTLVDLFNNAILVQKTPHFCLKKTKGMKNKVEFKFSRAFVYCLTKYQNAELKEIDILLTKWKLN